jgi:Icc-related predicted phosphoesterase
MKILCIGDPHGKLPTGLRQIVKDNNVDAIACVGDIPPVPKGFREKKGGGDFSKSFRKIADKAYERIVNKLCSFGLPVLTLRGNMYTSKEGAEITRKIFRKHKNLYNKKTGKTIHKNLTFIFFDMIWEKHSLRSPSKSKFLRANKSRERRLNKLLKENKVDLLLSHAPPYGVLDKIHSGKHVGCKILFNAIKKHQPKYCICGHIHEAEGKKSIGKTKVINLGCGGWKVLEL